MVGAWVLVVSWSGAGFWFGDVSLPLLAAKMDVPGTLRGGSSPPNRMNYCGK